MSEDDLSRGGGDDGDVSRGWPDRASLAVVRRVADREGVSASELPALNETVDPDALDAVAGEEAGTWPAVTTTYEGLSVRVDPVEGVTLSPDDPGWDHVSRIDARIEDDGAAVVLELAERTGRDPTTVRRELSRILDLEALSRLNRPRANGVSRSGATVRFSTLGYDVVVEPEGVSVGSILRRLRSGGNVLVVGSVPDAIVDSAGSTLLDGDGPHLFGLFDREVGTVSAQLPAKAAAEATVVNHAAAARSAAAGTTTADGSTPGPTVTNVRGDLEAVREALQREFAATDAEGDLRLCLASLRPVVESREPAAVREFLEPLCEAVRERSALAHYTLPIDRESPAVRAIEPAFEATLELRLDGAAPERRWHFQDSGSTTAWARLER